MNKFRCKNCKCLISELDPVLCPNCGSKDCFEECKMIPISEDNLGVCRINKKCINCGLCKKVCLENIGNSNDDGKKCINCGQCIINCPMGAIVPKYDYKKVKVEIDNPQKIVVALISPAVRASLGEEFGMEVGTNVEQKIVTSLKKIGFNYVFDTTFGADLTVMEEASELLERIRTKGRLPQFTSCCSSWVKYLEIFHPELLPNLSSCKSPISMQNAMIKTYFAKENNLDSTNIVTVAITPCTSKKVEIKRAELLYGDYVLTTSELALFLREENIDFKNLIDTNFDPIFSHGSGAGVIFGNSGGVTEAVIRTLYYFLTGNNLSDKYLNYSPVRGFNNLKETIVKINNFEIRVLVIFGLNNFEKVIDKIGNYHFIEVMNCKGGCIGGGGQPLIPIAKQEEIYKKRIQCLYNCDIIDNVRSSYQNPDIRQIYQKYLGRPLSKISMELLHTTFSDKSSLLKNSNENKLRKEV